MQPCSTGLSMTAGRWTDLLQRFLKAGSRQLLAQELAKEACYLPDSTAFVIAPDQSGGPLLVLASAGPLRPARVEVGQHRRLSLSEWVLRTGEPTICTDSSTDPRAEFARQHRFGSGSMLSVPVKTGGETVFAITVHSPRCGDYLQQVQPWLECLAEIAALTMELKDRRQTAQKQGQQLHALCELSRLLGTAVDPATVLSLGVDVVTGLFDLDVCCALVKEEGVLHVVAARGLSPDLTKALELAPDGTLHIGRFSQSYLHTVQLPIRGRHDEIGYFLVARASAPVSDEEQRLLCTWTALAGVMLENARLQALASRSWQDSDAVLLAAMEATIPGSRTLSQATSELAAKLSVQLELSAEDGQAVTRAALLMRIGCLVSRPPATGESQSEVGAAVLASIPGLEEISRLVRHLHERFDGSGRPHGLAGDGIPLGSRIIAAAAAFCELVRGIDGQPLNPAAALISLKDGAGKQFDPHVVAALESVVWSCLKLDPASPLGGESPPAQELSPVNPADLRILTDREREILEWIAKGCSNREIAAALFLSEATVKTHVSRILQKLHLSDRTKAAVYLMRGGTPAASR